MPIAVSEDHEALRHSAQRWLADPLPAQRAAGRGRVRPRPSCRRRGRRWRPRAGSVCTSPRTDGGQGFTLSELAVVLEELGYALFPGPVLPTVLVAAVLARHGSAAQRARYLPGLADGTHPGRRGARAPDARCRRGTDRHDRQRQRCARCSGCPTRTALVLAPLDEGRWCLLDRGPRRRADDRGAAGARRHARPWASSSVDGRSPLTDDDPPRRVTDDDVRDLALVLAAAESAGMARWCLETASEYAKVRVQFGRPIGQFQAVKHALADMLVAVEQCAAVAWDAAAAWSASDERRRRRPSGR